MSFDHEETRGYPAMADEELQSFLSQEKLMYLATLTQDGWPHNTPILFLFDDRHLYFASLKWKKKFDNIRNNSRVSCSIDSSIEEEIRGVMVQGHARIISEEERRDEIEAMWIEQFGEFIDYGGDSKEEILENRDYVEIAPHEVFSWGGHVEET